MSRSQEPRTVVGPGQRAPASPAVGVRARPHALVALWEPGDEVSQRSSQAIEELLRAVAAHPRFELFLAGRVAPHAAERHLVGAPRPLDRTALAVVLRARPPLRGAQHDHRPPRPCPVAADACPLLDRGDLVEHGVERCRQPLMHARRVVAGHQVRLPAVPPHQIGQLLVADAVEHRRVGDLVAVQVQDRQHRSITDGVEELVAVPRRRHRPGLRLAVTDDARNDEIGVVERGAERMGQGVAQLTALVDGARDLRRHVAWDAARERELPEQPRHPCAVTPDRRVGLGPAPLQPGVRHQRRATVARAGDEQHVEVPSHDLAVEVRVEQVQARRRTPVPQQPWLDVLVPEGLVQQRVAEQVDLTDRQVVRRPPVAIDAVQLVGCEHRTLDDLHGARGALGMSLVYPPLREWQGSTAAPAAAMDDAGSVHRTCLRP
jgi:hypothetical protein